MIYTYECEKHGEFDVVSTVKGMKNWRQCPQCGFASKKVIVKSYGGIQTDNDVPWIADAADQLVPDGERPFETRSQYKRYLSQKGIEPKA